MSRLPQPGADDGLWGDVLNDYLRREHHTDGSHNTKAMLAAPVTNGMIPVSDAASTRGISWQPSSTLQGAPGREIELQTTSTHLQWRFVNDIAWSNLVALTEITGPSGPDGQQGAPGLGVPLGGAVGQWLRKTGSADYESGWTSPGKADVGLSEVDNTSDAAKPVSAATQQAINYAQRMAIVMAVVL